MDQQASQTNISQIPEAPKTLVSSSAVIGYSYDNASYTLDVWFKGKSNAVHRYYLAYPNIISQVFDSGGSIGKKLQGAVKGLRSIKLK